MPSKKMVWTANLPVEKRATVRQFVATSGTDNLEINVASWGKGDLKVNGIEIARIKDRKNRCQTFIDLRKIAERHVRNSSDTSTRSK